KYNPAVKEAHDLEGLWAGLRDWLISTVGSDHIPVRAKDKDLTGKDIWTARGGAPGSGTILPVLLSEGVHRGRLSIEQVAAVTSYNAAHVWAVPPQGSNRGWSRCRPRPRRSGSRANAAAGAARARLRPLRCLDVSRLDR